MDDKRTLRRRMLARRRAYSETLMDAASEAVSATLEISPEVMAARQIVGYMAMTGELRVESFLRGRLAKGVDILLPKHTGEVYGLARTASMDSGMVEGAHGILEPDSPPVPSDTLAPGAVWLVPGVAFDLTGGRLGRGGGVYDALLRQAPGLRIGLSLHWQIVESLPADPWDQKVDIIITETDVHVFNTQSNT